MKQNRSKRARDAAERAFADEDAIDPKNMIRFTPHVELPEVYSSAEQVHKEMERAWRAYWVSKSTTEVCATLRRKWRSTVAGNGVVEILDTSGIVRAVGGRNAGGPPLKILSRWRIEEELYAPDAHYRLLVRDWENGDVLRESSFAPVDRRPHPELAAMSKWLDKTYPEHRNPLRGWEDCERIVSAWDDPEWERSSI